MNTIINLTLFILAFTLALALFQQLYFSAFLITIFAVIISKYVKEYDFRKFLNNFFSYFLRVQLVAMIYY